MQCLVFEQYVYKVFFNMLAYLLFRLALASDLFDIRVIRSLLVLKLLNKTMVTWRDFSSWLLRCSRFRCLVAYFSDSPLSYCYSTKSSVCF
jgi:hypothetical protein